MTPELTILTYAALLQATQLGLAILFGDAQTGIKYGAGPRDTPNPLTGLAGRFDRALKNHYAALALFTIAVLVVTLGKQSTPLTLTCAWDLPIGPHRIRPRLYFRHSLSALHHLDYCDLRNPHHAHHGPDLTMHYCSTNIPAGGLKSLLRHPQKNPYAFYTHIPATGDCKCLTTT